MNVGWAAFHLVIYKLSVYVLNSHWSDRALLHWEWTVAMLYSSHWPIKNSFIELQLLWLDWMSVRAGHREFSLTWLDRVAGKGELCENDLSKHIQCPVLLLVGLQDVPPSVLVPFKFRGYEEGHYMGQSQFWRILNIHSNSLNNVTRCN